MKIRITDGVGIRGKGFARGQIVDLDERDARAVVAVGRGEFYTPPPEPEPPVAPPPPQEPVVDEAETKRVLSTESFGIGKKKKT